MDALHGATTDESACAGLQMLDDMDREKRVSLMQGILDKARAEGYRKGLEDVISALWERVGRE